MGSMIFNALRQLAVFMYQNGMIIIITGLILVVANYFLSYLPMYTLLPSYIKVAFNGLMLLTIWLRVRTYFSQG